jgi:hypothetical protein
LHPAPRTLEANRLERRKPRKREAFQRWRVPDSNRGHHDFQRYL